MDKYKKELSTGGKRSHVERGKRRRGMRPRRRRVRVEWWEKDVYQRPATFHVYHVLPFSLIHIVWVGPPLPSFLPFSFILWGQN